MTVPQSQHYQLTPKAKKEFDRYWAWKPTAFYSLLAVFVFLFVSVSYFPQYSMYVSIPFTIFVFANLMMAWHYLRLNYFFNHRK